MESTLAAREALQPSTQYCPWYMKTKAAILFKKLLSNMSSYSQESRTLLSTLRSHLETALPLKAPPPPGLLECSSCEGFMAQPLCLPCGHSVCKACLEKLRSSLTHSILCPRCRHTYPHKPPGSTSDRKPTLILQNAFQKWYPKWLEACSHRVEGNRFAQEGDFPLAVHWYNKAAETGVRDHRVLGNRCRSYLAMEQLEEALSDAESCCKLRPSWAKGHFRRASVLEKVGRWKEAVVEYLLCLHLGGNDQFVVKAVCKLLDQHLPKFQEDHQSEGDRCSVGEIVRLCVEVMAGCEAEGEGGEGVMDVPSHLLDQSDFECVLCTGLLYSPTTTVCGHSFCRICLSRSFDHSPFCPVCRSPLVENFMEHCQTSGKMSVDVTLEGLLLRHFPAAYEEKRAQVEAELQRRSRAGLSEEEELPIFSCTMAYPGMPCPLHIFEPKYRLMIRRCMETNSRRFGMCHPSNEEGSTFATYGTVLHIDSVEYTLDGRSLISTVGEMRFRVVSTRVTDGYNTARIEFITDTIVSRQEDIASLRALQQEVYDYAHRWLSALPYSCRILLMQTASSPLPDIDPSPECCPNGPKWVWWYVHALPTSYERKLEFLKSKSLRQRLLMLKESLHLPTNVR